MTTLLDVSNLTVEFGTGAERVRPVNGLDLQLQEGGIVGLVGESGCGKSLTGMAILGMAREVGASRVEGKISFRGEDILALDMESLRRMRRSKIGFVAQNPMTALDPLVPVGTQVAEVAACNLRLSRRAARELATQALGEAGIPEPQSLYARYPHELSGGMCQRVVIAGAIVSRPALIIADEPTTALDVSTQTHILDLLVARARSDGMGLLLITHDLTIVAETCDHVAVMYAGSVVEYGPTDRLLVSPLHPYTQGLLACLPGVHLQRGQLRPIPGEVASPVRPPTGCRFHPRCESRMAVCVERYPDPVVACKDRRVRCHLHPGVHE
jgi:oligopeptide/dipeptide ABC transporter ATP-binding protein